MASTLHPFNRYIADLKRRLLIIGSTIMVAFVAAFTLSSALIDWFKRPFADDLIFYGPAEALFASIKVSFLAGVVASFPVILHQFWRFIQPALLAGERRWAIPLFLLASSLFVLGLVVCNLIILPLVINFFVTFGLERELTPELAVGTYVDFNVRFLLVFGFAFELPLALTLLARAGLVSSAILVRYRKHAAMAALIFSAILTPDATLFTMMLMAIPLIILYEIGVLGAKLFGRRTIKPENQEGESSSASQETAGERIR